MLQLIPRVRDLLLFPRVRAYLATRDRGATAVEYALIIAVVAMVVVVAAVTLGDQISDLFTDAGNCVEDPTADGACER
jgi:pilus assembly protein Flp/PilA